ncbi:uncharacterized protein LOC124139144 [Haliotis rufescens]|uniref:uncharacterized protein LOC124139144 n=1 Tax=Haliotis rufescens TaxID=6454 RepID=UPI00201E90A6|nr:uncharacterized protein LOC124139144 [Haliotis rufescens]
MLGRYSQNFLAFTGCIRAPEEVEKKWHNIQSKARGEIARCKQGVISTDGDPSPCPTLTATSEVVWYILGQNNVSISGIPSAMDTSLLQVVSLSDTVNASEYSDMAALDLQTLQAMGGAVPTASTVSVPSQPEPSVPDTASSAGTISARYRLLSKGIHEETSRMEHCPGAKVLETNIPVGGKL